MRNSFGPNVKIIYYLYTHLPQIRPENFPGYRIAIHNKQPKDCSKPPTITGDQTINTFLLCTYYSGSKIVYGANNYHPPLAGLAMTVGGRLFACKLL
jgi:hypothetical protein